MSLTAGVSQALGDRLQDVGPLITWHFLGAGDKIFVDTAEEISPLLHLLGVGLVDKDTIAADHLIGDPGQSLDAFGSRFGLADRLCRVKIAAAEVDDQRVERSPGRGSGRHWVGMLVAKPDQGTGDEQKQSRRHANDNASPCTSAR